MDSRRAEAFSDGVFAVAITILVFDLLSIGTHGLSARVLLEAWPSYVAYVVSFLTIGIMWINHHTILGHVKRVDRPLLVLNLLLLMVIVAIPFPTQLVAEHLRGRGGTAATVTYGLVMIAMSAGFTLGGAVYVAGTLIAAFWSPVAGLIIFGALAVYYLFEHLPSPAEQPAAD